MVVVELEANQTQIQRIIQSKAFRTSEVHRNLLQYLADKSLAGQADSLKEYTVGLDVFSKPASYDPRQESVVRMHVARLRQKLAEYYRTEGINDAVIVELPKGGFRVTFEQREAPADPRPVAGVVPGEESSRTNVKILGGLLAATAVCAVVLGIQVWRLKHAAPDTTPLPSGPEIQAIWGPILNSNRPLMICLASGHSVGAASGAFLLGQFLAHRKDNVLLTRSDQLAMPEVLMDNVVFLGPVSGNPQIEALTQGQPLVLEPDGIHNLRPRPGEPAFIADRAAGAADRAAGAADSAAGAPDLPGDASGQRSKDVEETHALISHVPGLYGHGDILYLSGNQISSTLAAVRALTDPTLARELVAKLKAPDGTVPRFYQMVLRVQSMDSMPIEISYLFHRDLSPPGKP
jgi:hypothetical protein